MSESRSGPATVTPRDERIADYLGHAVEVDGVLTLTGWRRIRIGNRFVFPDRGEWSWPASTVRVTWLTESEQVAA